MSMDGGNSSLGSLLGSVVSKTAAKTTKKSTTAGRSVGSAASRAIRRSSGGSSSSGRSSSRSSGYSSSRSSGSRSSGGSSRSSSGGAGSSIGRAVAKAPSVPSIGAYLGTDSIYQQAVSGGKRSLTDFISELNRRRGEATTQYNMTNSSMDRDREQQLASLRDEYASRGLIQSGVYGEEVGKFEKQFGEQRNALSQQQAALIADLLSQQTNYKRENDLALQAAKQEALARRSSKYNIGG